MEESNEAKPSNFCTTLSTIGIQIQLCLIMSALTKATRVFEANVQLNNEEAVSSAKER